MKEINERSIYKRYPKARIIVFKDRNDVRMRVLDVGERWTCDFQMKSSRAVTSSCCMWI